MPLVSVGIVTWHSAAHVAECLAAVRAQSHADLQLLVADNDSRDGTRAVLEAHTTSDERLYLDRNTGFAAAHNRLIARSRGDFYLALNPDVVLDRHYVAQLVDACRADPRTGSATGKLLRRDPPGVIDSTGIVMLPSMRHLDRGAEELDRGQFDAPDEVFGASGAAALYTRAMLDDVRVEGEWFDEDFFAYREDADLAWRAQLLGWRCRYVPGAVATHVRRVTPERRADLPPEVNRWSVRNRFLLRIKNQTPRHAVAFLAQALGRDIQVVGYVLLREWSSIGGLTDVVRVLPRMLRKRRQIMARRRASHAEMARWFRGEPGPPGGRAISGP
jgi:GT2 family glycosyltransferase